MKKLKEYTPLEDLSSILPILDKISIFGGLNREQLQFLFSSLKKTVFAKNEIIFKQGEMPTHIYIIRSGKVKLVIEAGHTNLELIEFDTGKSFGETALIGMQPQTATAVATEETEIIVLSSTALMECLKSDKELFAIIVLNIARDMCRRLGRSDNILLHYFKDKK